jgi:hypothetical protein
MKHFCAFCIMQALDQVNAAELLGDGFANSDVLNSPDVKNVGPIDESMTTVDGIELCFRHAFKRMKSRSFNAIW